MRSSLGRVSLLVVLLAAKVLASPCAIDTLANYVSLGAGGCTINGEIVANFNFMVVATSLGSPLTAGAITVTPSFTATKYQLFFSATGLTPATGFTVRYCITAVCLYLSPSTTNLPI